MAKCICAPRADYFDHRLINPLPPLLITAGAGMLLLAEADLRGNAPKVLKKDSGRIDSSPQGKEGLV